MRDITGLVFDICRIYAQDAPELSEPERLRVLGHIRARDFRWLANVSSQLGDVYRTPLRTRTLMQVEAFFSKNECFASPDETRSAAIQSFDKAEMLCRIGNRRLSYYYLKRDRLDPDLQLWMDRMEKYISSTLGTTRRFANNLVTNLRFTDGATASRSRRESRPFEKVSLRPRAPTGCHDLLRNLGEFLGYRVKPRHQNVNRVEFVPKSWKTDRGIACEPEGGLVLQLAFDTYVKTRLKRRGIDLGSQTRNSQLAKIGSIFGSYATIDLSMASDTLSRACVEWLIPYEWLAFLKSVRSPMYRHPDGTIREYAKFSSMGNGATFTLETLIFAAACRAVGSNLHCVYGDDIVIETELVPDLLKLLKFLGFVPNVDKSHYSLGSPFRESCGGNYHSGTNVTPFYFRHMDSRKSSMSRIVNGVVKLAGDIGSIRLLGYAKGLLETFKLHLVPYNEDDTSGVWIDPGLAHDLKVVTKRGPRFADTWNCLFFRGYSTREKRARVTDSRTLFLWHLRSAGGALSYSNLSRKTYGLRSDLETSLVPTFSHKYVRKWIRWTPANGTPLHLFWWGEFLSRPG